MEIVDALKNLYFEVKICIFIKHAEEFIIDQKSKSTIFSTLHINTINL
jgi:hypothetical protein